MITKYKLAMSPSEPEYSEEESKEPKDVKRRQGRPKLAEKERMEQDQTPDY